MDKWNRYRWILGGFYMNFSELLLNGQIRKASKDAGLIKSLVKTAEEDLIFLESIPLNEQSARKVMSNYYDVLRSILEAVALLEGYKIYTHEAFTFFLKEKKEERYAAQFDRFRKIRNGINYYGKTIAPEETKINKEQICQLIAKLQEKYLNEYRP